MHKDLFGEENEDYAQRCLIAAIILLVYLLLGKSLMRLFMGKKRPGEDQPKTEGGEEVELTRADGTIIHVDRYGDKKKPGIVFLHGWNSNSMQWYYQKKRFSRDYHLILVDLPGLGKSTKPRDKDFSLEKLAADLKTVLDKIKPIDPVLWGHSMGGFTILTFCKLFTGHLRGIKGLILEHTTYTNPVKTSIMSRLLRSIQNPVLKPVCWILIGLSPLIWISKWMSFLNGNTLIMTRLLTFAGTQSYEQLNFASYLSTLAPPAVTGRGVLAMFKYDATSTLGSIDTPVLIIGAAQDRLTKPEASEYMQSRIKNSQLLTLEPAGHMGLMERHSEVNDAVESFLKRL